MNGVQIERPRTTLMTAVILMVTTLWIAIRMPATIQSFGEMIALVLAFGFAAWALNAPMFALRQSV